MLMEIGAMLGWKEHRGMSVKFCPRGNTFS